jgi:hypothetical protein
MKRLLCLQVVVSLTLLACLSRVGSAQAPVREGQIDFTPQRSISLSGQPLTIKANNIGQHGAVAVQVVTGTTLRARAWALTYGGTKNYVELERLQNIGKLPAADVTWSNNTLTVNGNSITDRTGGNATRDSKWNDCDTLREWEVDQERRSQ